MSKYVQILETKTESEKIGKARARTPIPSRFHIDDIDDGGDDDRNE